MRSVAVTVLMAVYNGGEYLKTAIDSVCAQDFKDFELLIIDDGSSDGVMEAIGRLPDPRIRIHRNPVNMGQTASLNKGLSLARGTYVARMDADDMAYSHWLGQQWSFLHHDPDCAVVGCGAVVMDEGGRVYKKLRSPALSCDMILKSFFASPLNHVGGVMRREIVLAQGGYDSSLRIAADYDLWSRLLRRGIKIAARPRVGVMIRAHQASVTASNKGAADIPEVCRIMGENVKHYTRIDLSEQQLKLWWGYAYEPASLSVEEFNGAENLMAEVYSRVRGKFIGCQDEHIRRFIRSQQRIAFLKALFGLSRFGRQTQVRSLLGFEAHKQGFCSFPSMVRLITCGGGLCAWGANTHDFFRKCQTVLLK